MKKNFKLFAVACIAMLATVFVSCDRNSEPDAITYKLEIAPDAFTYDENGAWDALFDSTQTVFTSQVFSFIHTAIPSWFTWYGFMPSIAQKDGDGFYQYYSCVAKGGLKGVGTPYILAYYAGAYGAPNVMVFTEEKTGNDLLATPQEIYFCNATQSYKDVTEGDYTGYKFSSENNDYFVVKVYGLVDVVDGEFVMTENSVDYYLADFRDGKSFVNNSWEKVDLTALGEVYGLYFTMESTGVGDYGINTSTYFALDGLKVKVSQKAE